MTYVQDLGFALEASNVDNSVAFTKNSAVVGRAFDEEIQMLRKKAVDLRGEYDGWGCPVAE